MGEFVVKQIAGSWAVVNDGIILANHANAHEAIDKAIVLAAGPARHDGPKRVIYHPSDAERRVVWDSETDEFRAE